MQWRKLQVYSVVCMLLLSNAADLSMCNDLPGSCVAAGYTTCCDSEEDEGFCAGDTEACFCDPSCREFNDCCSDLDEICPREDLFYPLTIFVLHTTYHSATLQWATAHVNSSFNHTFIVSYTNSSTSLLRVNSTSVVRIQHGPIGDVYSSILPHLSPNTTFFTNVISSSLFYGATVFEGPTFRTLSYPSVTNVRAKLFNTSTVQVSWDHLMLPEGVKVLKYLVFFGRERQQGEGEGEGEEEREIYELRLDPNTDQGLVSGLTSSTVYSFFVAAMIRDVDGTQFETKRTPLLHVFIPSWQLIQVQGISSLSCSDWNVQVESRVTTTFQHSITSVIRSKCSCSFTLSHLTEASLICRNFADIGTSSTSSSHSYVTFRAKLLSLEDHMTDSLLDHLESWVATAPLVDVEGFDSGLELEVKLSPNCPLRLSRKSEPLCVTGCDGERRTGIPVAQEFEVNKTDTVAGCVITVPILVASLAAELLLLLSVFLVSIVVSLAVISRRDRKRQPTELSFLTSGQLTNCGRHTSTNTYATAPSLRTGQEPGGDAVVRDEGRVRITSSNTAASGLRNSTHPVGESSLVGSEPCDSHVTR